jgi:hypothetical protein
MVSSHFRCFASPPSATSPNWQARTASLGASFSHSSRGGQHREAQAGHLDAPDLVPSGERAGGIVVRQGVAEVCSSGIRMALPDGLE